eukprot:scaffold133259_cov112-Phaeocystis_antarctica.AAC.5
MCSVGWGGDTGRTDRKQQTDREDNVLRRDENERRWSGDVGVRTTWQQWKNNSGAETSRGTTVG